MRKIIKHPDDVVDEGVDGILAAHPRMLKAVSRGAVASSRQMR
jgi:dihydroxyacetone kinase